MFVVDEGETISRREREIQNGDVTIIHHCTGFRFSLHAVGLNIGRAGESVFTEGVSPAWLSPKTKILEATARRLT